MIMLKCWELEPTDRPKFSELVVAIESYLTEMAGYLDFNRLPQITPQVTPQISEKKEDVDVEDDQGSEIHEESITISFVTDSDD